jgi:archaemetzincin
VTPLLLALVLSASRTVVVVPLGPVDQAFIDGAVEAVKARVDADVRVDPRRELPRAAWYEPRKRWRAERILDAIEAAPPKGAWKVLVITAAEISTTKGDIKDWGIAGLGNIGGLASVASTFLYTKHSKSKAQALRRFTDVAVHEFGHTLGLPHCETTGCVMADAKGKAMKSADASRGHYCLRCRQTVEPGVLKPLAW